MDAGSVLFSTRMTDSMNDLTFAGFVGQSFAKHLLIQFRHNWPVRSTYKYQAPYSSSKKIVIITELDRNRMPRTSIVFDNEAGTC